ncbi:McrC family protein [Lentzea flaviverrucosa]|uniref:McrC family protein n=1 Tax=Lentzea flaviverrucosa TaxID=200379 RepID=UPI0014768958|nr:restriction endonuclease [Lentzea flaviverrucosa]
MVPKVKRVGAVHAHGLDVVVTPKVTISRLLFMLGYAMNPGFLPENVEGVTAADLWAAVAETLCRNVERALVRGVLLGYTTEHATSTVIRGRIRVGDQITSRPGRLMPVEITHDEFTVDIPENRLLRAAVSRMISVPRVDPMIRTRLRHLLNRLADVSPLTHGAPSPHWRATRLNARYHPALRIAQLVLDTLSFEVGEDGLSIASFVVNMEKVFEDFVTTALTEAWNGGRGRTERQYPAKLDTDKAISMTVDVVHLVDEVPQVIVDAKYKLETASGRYPNSDIYQVLAYCTALQVNHAWLVYAGDSAKITSHCILNSSITITTWALDLQASPQDLVAQVERLAQIALT